MNKTLALLSIVALALAGCSGGKTDPASTSPDASSNTASNSPTSTSTAGNPAAVAGKTGAPAGDVKSAPTGSTATESTATPPKAPDQKGSASPAAAGGLVGTWKGEATNLPSTLTPQQAQTAQDAAKAAALEVKGSHQFTLGSGAQSASGTWKLSGATLSLKMENFSGKSINEVKAQIEKQMGANGAAMAKTIIAQMEKPIEFSVSSDQKTLTSIPRAGEANKGTLVLHKQ